MDKTGQKIAGCFFGLMVDYAEYYATVRLPV